MDFWSRWSCGFVALLVSFSFRPLPQGWDKLPLDSLGFNVNDIYAVFRDPGLGKRLAKQRRLVDEFKKARGAQALAAGGDATAHAAVAQKHGVTGYPSLKFFKQGDAEGEKYQGPREVRCFRFFVL